jgi:hypothetical protein
VAEEATMPNKMLACRTKVDITMGLLVQEANKIPLGHKDLQRKTFKEEDLGVDNK